MMQVVSFAGDLLSSAEGLLRDGLHTSEVAEGYTKAATKVHLSRPTSSAVSSLLGLLHMQISSALLSLLVSCILQTFRVPEHPGLSCCLSGILSGSVNLFQMPCACHITLVNIMQALEIMEKLILPGSEKMDVRDPVAVAKRIKGSVCSKQYGYEDMLSPLIAKVSSLLIHCQLWNMASGYKNAQEGKVHMKPACINMPCISVKFLGFRQPCSCNATSSSTPKFNSTGHFRSL